MLGHDRKGPRPPALARFAPALLLAAWALAPCASAQDIPRLVPAEPVRFSADRVSHWTDLRGVRWVLLEGNAAVLQGGDGLRAATILSRLQVQGQGQVVIEVESYAEGQSRTTEPDSRPKDARRASFRTTSDPTLSAYKTKGLTKLDAAPSRLAIRDRGFKDDLAPPVKAPDPDEIPHPPRAELGPPQPVVEAAATAPRRDAAVRRTQDDGIDVGAPPMVQQDDQPDEMPQQEPDPFAGQVPDVEPLPDAPGMELPEEKPRGPVPMIEAPVLAGTQRTFSIGGGPNLKMERFNAANGEIVMVFRGGVNLIADIPRKGLADLDGTLVGGKGVLAYQTVDISADNMVIWTREKKGTTLDPSTGVKQDPDEPLQVYLEGNVRIRQDNREVAGKGDEKVFEAESAYYDMRTERMMALNGRVFTSSPALITPLRTDGAVINQYRKVEGVDAKGNPILGPTFIRIDDTTTTGSRFPVPGYRFDSSSLEIEDITVPLVDQTTGGKVGPGKVPAEQDKLYEIRAFNSAYFLGRVPVFYLPFTRFTSDFDPILRNIRFQTGNVFGQQIQFDFSGFRLLGLRKPQWVDNWNIDVDYLSYRGLALGSEFSWFGRDLIGEISDPYNRSRVIRDVDQPYFGYFDIWGLRDGGRDILGPGPAIITNGPPKAGKAGYQRTSVPPFQNFRGRLTLRQMQRLIGEDAPDDMELRYQLEVGYSSDRHFIEEYYKRLFDSGLDQSTLAYGIYQRKNRTFTALTEANLLNWYTQTQYFPKLDYYRLADAFLDNWVNVSLHAGADYANTHTAVEVNNPNIFAYMPYDPVSNTSGSLTTGRLYSAAEVDVPLQLGPVKLTPYAQGQLVGWNNQLAGQPLGRAWGAVGARANLLAWRTFEGPQFESELLNIHGLAHKINLIADARSAYSNLPLNRIGVQDNLDDNTYEYTRRYFALTNYVGGLLPAQYDPRFLTLRRQISPITGTTDIQDTIQTVNFNLNQRLQTKRGPEGARRIIDYMVLDLHTTYFPNASRDNFGKPFGQNTYNYEWYLGDRTSFVSYGWFEFWKVSGQSITTANPVHANDPFGLNVITSGFSINRPPRGTVFVGYSIINTGPIATSALNFSFTYWLSPKWYTNVATSYDFGNRILLGTTFSLTKITKDYLTSLGLNVDPQRMNYTFAFEISPRFSPNVRLGSTAGSRFDSRFAPSQ